MNIAIIDYTLGGHHLSFIRSFSQILLQQGHEVICVVPGKEKVESWITEQLPLQSDRFSAFEFNWKSPAPAKSRFSQTMQVLRRWRYEKKLLKKIEKEKGKKIDLVFFAWLDDHLAPYIPSFLLDNIFPYKWSGLYFHPYHLRRETVFLERKANWRDLDAVFLSENCLAVAIHDSGIREKFSYRINKPVIHFPETADDTAPDPENELAGLIRKKAGNRIVIGMIGCEKHKGTLTLARLIAKADPSKYFFAFLGILPENTYTAEEWKEINEFINERRENCFFHFQPVPEGAAYNAVFCSFDIPFLVYDDFVSSSNRLTKAAIFQRLVLASDNYCVGEDVKKFRLGAAVKPQDHGEALNGLEKLAGEIKRNDYPAESWKVYKDINSIEKLYERFSELTKLSEAAFGNIKKQG
jgi:hypothetical protein